MGVPSQNDNKKRVLHVTGSNKNEFYFAVVHLDATWSFPSTLDKKAISESTRYSEKDALQKISESQIDVMVPHMFCPDGVTYYRSIFDKIGIPFVGNKESTILNAFDKGITKKVLNDGGVQVPKGEVLTKGEHEYPREKVEYPCIVKPCNEDNSLGLSLVKKEEDLTKAIEFAFKYSKRILVDEYIAGREIRVGVIEEEDGTLTVLPKLEYYVNEIRTTENKLGVKDGKLTDTPQADVKKDGDRDCPAILSPVLERRLNEQAKKAHEVMKCTHYSLWDMRVDENEQPFILEACLFCSFSPLSIISTLADKADRDDIVHPKLFHTFLDRVVSPKALAVVG